MTWVFGLFLVTSCALTSCHAVMSKQEDDITIRALGYNRCRDENHAVRFGQCAENRRRARDTADQRRL